MYIFINGLHILFLRTSARITVRLEGRPPMLVSVMFTEEMCHLMFEFDMPVTSVHDEFDCSDIFAGATFDMLGEGN